MIGKQKKGLEMTTTINKEQKNPNVPNLRFPEFSGEWMYSTIGSEFDLYSGNTPSRLNKEQFKGDVNWISSGELKEHYISETKEKITQEAAKNNNLKLLPIGTFVIAIYGLEAEGIRGTCSITRGLSTISQACMAFTPIGSITNEFLYSWYKKHGNLIGIKYAQGTKQQNLSYDIISQFQIDYPQREEQVKLEQFISLLDERIATQNKIIDNAPADTISISEGGNSCGYIQYNREAFWSGGHCYTLNNITPNVCKLYLYHNLKSQESSIMKLRIGTGLPNIQKKDLEKFCILLPSKAKQESISTFLTAIESKIANEEMLQNYFQEEKLYLLRQMFI